LNKFLLHFLSFLLRLSPAVVKTNFFEPNFGLNEEDAEKLVYAECFKNYTMQRPGEPKDIAEAIAFLASEKRASWISGSVLDVDGGSMWTSKGLET
jgi:NAD(P)-dependent dehydrogenase (short-subunit alcohol dehydrogenase family)